MDRARAWAEAKAREKAEITSISTKAREKVDPEAKATERAKEKYIAAKRVTAEVVAETRVRVEAKADVRYQDVGILAVVLNKFKAASNLL